MTTPDIPSLVESVPMDHVIDRTASEGVQLAQAEGWIRQLMTSYQSIQQTCANKDTELLRLRAELEMAQAERDVLNGSWCATNISEGRGKCGVCKTCLRAELAEEKRKVEERRKDMLEEVQSIQEALSWNQPSVANNICTRVIAALTAPSEGGEIK